jgi:WD40 repeat protein
MGCTPTKLEKINAIIPTTTALVATSTVSSASPTQHVVLFPDQSALPTISFNTPVPATPGPYSTPDVNQFEYPYFEPTEIPGLLLSHLTIETVPDSNGIVVQRISGWRYGFNNLEWMDKDHLLLYPVAGIFNQGGGQHPGIYPAVINLDTSTFWIPLPNKRGGNYYPALPRWSEKLGVLIAATSDTSVAIHSPDGAIKKVYKGTFLGISPSATKVLIDESWIDLSSGKAVKFAWQQDEIAANSGLDSFLPIWSPDETRVYTCCYLYGDASTGESQVMPYYQITLDGEKTQFMLEELYGTWVLNDKYLLPIWGGIWDGRYGAVYLFDPNGKTYRNLSALAGIRFEWQGEADPYCTQPSAQNGGRYIWVDCMDGGHLIDVATFRSRTYPPPSDGPYGGGYYQTRDMKWSPDGNFVWFSDSRTENILSGATGDLKPLPSNCYAFEWHPNDNVLLCMSNDNQKLFLLDAQTVSIKKEFALPAEFAEFTWSPGGKHIELIASDKSLWRLDYPRLEHLEQLTPPLSQLLGQNYSNLVWSADNSAIAFIREHDIYVVQLGGKP